MRECMIYEDLLYVQKKLNYDKFCYLYLLMKNNLMEKHV